MLIGESETYLPIHTKLSKSGSSDESIEESMKALSRDFLDLLYIHERLSLDKGQKANLERIYQLKGSTVGAIGASVYDMSEFEIGMERTEIEVLQVPLNIMNRTFPPQTISAARAGGKKIYARSVLLQGVLMLNPEHLPNQLSKLRPFLREYRELAMELRVSVLELALGFIVENFELDGIVVGVSSPAELEEVVTVVARPRSADFVRILSSFEPPPFSLVDPRRWS